MNRMNVMGAYLSLRKFGREGITEQDLEVVFRGAKMHYDSALISEFVARLGGRRIDWDSTLKGIDEECGYVTRWFWRLYGDAFDGTDFDGTPLPLDDKRVAENSKENPKEDPMDIPAVSIFDDDDY